MGGPLEKFQGFKTKVSRFQSFKGFKTERAGGFDFETLKPDSETLKP
jgi:hypothetical protein